MRSTSRVNSFSTILQLKIFNEMERCLCFNWFYRFTWPCVLYPRDATVVEEHAVGSFIGSFAFRRSFFFRTRPGFHKILDPFFPYWTKQVWQSTLFYKQMITSFSKLKRPSIDNTSILRWERCFIFPENWIEPKTADHAARIIWDIKTILLFKEFWQWTIAGNDLLKLFFPYFSLVWWNKDIIPLNSLHYVNISIVQ